HSLCSCLFLLCSLKSDEQTTCRQGTRFAFLTRTEANHQSPFTNHHWDMSSESGSIRVAALADLHFTRAAVGTFQPLFSQVASHADILVLCGDLTDHGSLEEAQLLARELASVKVPLVGVLGNHDYEADVPDEVKKILTAAGMIVLDGD